MSKSYDNYIAFSDSASDIYGKTLSIPDELIIKYFEYCTRVNDLDKIKQSLENGKDNPRDLKRRLARELVTIYHNSDLALKAEQDFDNLFINKDIPDDIPEIKIDSNQKIVEIMVSNNMVASNGEAKRLIKQGGVKVGDKKITDINLEISPNKNIILKVGKRKFLKII